MGEGVLGREDIFHVADERVLKQAAVANPAPERRGQPAHGGCHMQLFTKDPKTRAGELSPQPLHPHFLEQIIFLGDTLAGIANEGVLVRRKRSMGSMPITSWACSASDKGIPPPPQPASRTRPEISTPARSRKAMTFALR